jgi:sugar phosphate isomerase/epimerase
VYVSYLQDTYHMHIEESGFESAVRLCGDKLGYVHIGESHRWGAAAALPLAGVTYSCRHMCGAWTTSHP